MSWWAPSVWGHQEAFRIKVFSFFSNDSDGSVTIRSEENQLLAGWEDYWYPEYMPDGFELVGAEEDDMGKYMLFESDNSDEYKYHYFKRK